MTFTRPDSPPGARPPPASAGEGLRLVHDISMLGYSYGRPGTTTGIARVVRTLALALRERDDCDLRFCSSLLSTLPGAVAHLSEDPELADVPLVNAERLTRPLGALAGARLRLERLPTMLPVQAARRAAAVGIAIMERRAASVEPRQLRDAQIFHSPFHGFPPAVERVPGLRRFLTVHDLIPLLYPEFFEFRGEHFLTGIIRGLRPDDWVVAISEATRADLLKVRPDLDPARVRVTPLAADPRLFRPIRDAAVLAGVRARYGIPEGPYLLALSTLEPRKNLDRLVRAFARLVRQERLDLRLVLAGARGWKTDALFRAIDEAGPVRDRVVLAGFVDDADLAPLYSGATAFVYPSLYEGFGLPPLEAMQCGVPVITSNTSSLPEVVGEAGVQVDPRDVEALAGALLRVCGDGGLRERMGAASLARASEFTWARTAALTLQAYRAAVHGN